MAGMRARALLVASFFSSPSPLSSSRAAVTTRAPRPTRAPAPATTGRRRRATRRPPRPSDALAGGDAPAIPPGDVTFTIDLGKGPARQFQPPSAPVKVPDTVYGINGFGSFVASGTKFGSIRQRRRRVVRVQLDHRLRQQRRGLLLLARQGGERQPRRRDGERRRLALVGARQGHPVPRHGADHRPRVRGPRRQHRHRQRVPAVGVELQRRLDEQRRCEHRQPGFRVEGSEQRGVRREAPEQGERALHVPRPAVRRGAPRHQRRCLRDES